MLLMHHITSLLSMYTQYSKLYWGCLCIHTISFINIISANAPNVLLYGALLEAYIFMKGEQDVIALYEKRFMDGLSRLKDLGEARENHDAYRRGLPSRPRT